jgi:multimeric flavodoxin WrbA
VKNPLQRKNEPKKWVCSVCGYVHLGDKPPSECPQCSSPGTEFLENSGKKSSDYNGEKFDVLLINGSSHKSHNTGLMVDLAEKILKKNNISCRRINLNEVNINHCWCCYSMADAACTYPCRNQLDDMPKLHEMLVNSKAVIIASPINWNNMSARLKDFLDRTTSIQNRVLLKQNPITTGKIVGIMIDGHEDGAAKTMMDIFLYFQQMGYVMAPFGFAYRTHGAENNAKTDNDFFKKDEFLTKSVGAMVKNVITTIKLDFEKKLKDHIKPVCE